MAQLHKEKDKLIADSDEAQKKLYRERDTLDEKLQTHKSHLEENLKYVIFDSNPKILSQLLSIYKKADKAKILIRIIGFYPSLKATLSIL